MGLKGEWAEARERGRRLREEDHARIRRIARLEQLRRLGVPVPASVRELEAAAMEEALDGMVTAEEERRAELYEVFVRSGTVTTFRAPGVQLPAGGDVVHTIGIHDPRACRSRRPRWPARTGGEGLAARIRTMIGSRREPATR